MPRRLPFAALVAVAILATACGTSSAAPDESQDNPAAESAAPMPSMTTESAAPPSAPEAGTDLNACEIVTAADIATALDLAPADVPDGELTESPTSLSPGHTDCNFTGDWGGLKVSLTPEDGANLYDAARGSYADASDVEIAGTDGAFWSADAKRGFFWKGSVSVMLQLTHLTAGGDFEAATVAIGEAAMGRVD